MKSMGLRMMGMKDGLTDIEGNFTQACCMISRPIRLLLDLLVPHNNASPIHMGQPSAPIYLILTSLTLMQILP